MLSATCDCMRIDGKAVYKAKSESMFTLQTCWQNTEGTHIPKTVANLAVERQSESTGSHRRNISIALKPIKLLTFILHQQKQEVYKTCYTNTHWKNMAIQEWVWNVSLKQILQWYHVSSQTMAGSYTGHSCKDF